ncbi:unnamed protein product [Nesidiocoris tenuis]|uniref:PX domain-containing protein n=1 Tax=Nesidiocoris tenuis TaxID=355587 RepID=A0A6H5H1M2_9HEMI|nr:unnamed protein product [Nesidiocoris tenuis]
MELNDRLQRNMISKDVIIKRLYLELEALRGPLGPSEIDISAEMVSLWVPSVFMSGSPRSHHVYQIHIRAGAEEWNVYRRYSEFYDLHKDSKKQYPVISAFQFPPKKTIGNKGVSRNAIQNVAEQNFHCCQQPTIRRFMTYAPSSTPGVTSILTSTVNKENRKTKKRRKRMRKLKMSMKREEEENERVEEEEEVEEALEEDEGAEEALEDQESGGGGGVGRRRRCGE